MEMLLEKGANIDARNHLGRTPLHYAEAEDAVLFLLNRGADRDAKDLKGNVAFPKREEESDYSSEFCYAEF